MTADPEEPTQACVDAELALALTGLADRYGALGVAVAAASRTDVGALIDQIGQPIEPVLAESKPPVPSVTGPDWPHIPLDGNDPAYQQLVRIATFAADSWSLGPDGPYSRPGMTRADETRGHMAQGLALLLELGVIDIDRDRLAAWGKVGTPLSRPPRGDILA